MSSYQLVPDRLPAVSPSSPYSCESEHPSCLSALWAWAELSLRLNDSQTTASLHPALRYAIKTIKFLFKKYAVQTLKAHSTIAPWRVCPLCSGWRGSQLQSSGVSALWPAGLLVPSSSRLGQQHYAHSATQTPGWNTQCLNEPRRNRLSQHTPSRVSCCVVNWE